MVVPELSWLSVSRRGSTIETIHPISELPSALDRKKRFFQRLNKVTPIISLDYDGTLTPICGESSPRLF